MPKPIIYDKVVTKFLAGKSEHTLFLLNHFVDEFYYYECSSKADCLEHLLNDKYWDGKSFYEIESQLKWVDG